MKGKTGKILLGIIILGFLLRTYPYSHYPNLLTNDAMLDYQQVQYLQENEQINWAHPYGRNPTLHTIVYLVGLIGGVSTWNLALLIPQLISTLGILFFYLFLKEYVSERNALIACFLVAAYGPNIWWGAQAVRETIGLFYLPFVLYAFDRLAKYDGKTSRIIFAAAFLAMLVTHNWTTLIGVGMIAILTLTFYQSIKTLITSGLMILLAILYTKLNFTWYFEWLTVGMPALLKVAPIALLGIGMLYWLGKRSKEGRIEEVETSLDKQDILIIAAYIIFFILASRFLNRLLVFDYPPQEYLSIFLLGLLCALGIRRIRTNYRFYIPMLLLNIPLIVLVAVGLMFGTQADYDATRVIEYLVYPNAVIAALGFNSIRSKATKQLLIILVIVGGLLIYPPVFILGKQITPDSVYYDIRSHIRYIPEEGVETMIWGLENNITVLSVNPNYNSLRDTLYPVDGKRAYMVSEYDLKVMREYDKVRIGSLGIGNPEKIIKAAKGSKILYQNSWGTVYELDNNLTVNNVLGEYISYLRS